MGIKLYENIPYDKIFSPETIQNLKGKSTQSLRYMLDGENFMQALQKMQRLLPKVVEFEREYRDELEMVAVDMVKNIYPIIGYSGIEIDAKIVDLGDNELNVPKSEPPKEVKEKWEEIPDYKRRKIINGITQGGSVRGSFGFMMFREYLDQLDPELVEKYNKLLKITFGIYDDPNAVAMLLQMLGNNMKMEGGKVFIKTGEPEDGEEDEGGEEEEQKPLVIVARAICFPMLLHEILKGLYEIVSLQGFSGSKEQNQDIVNRVDSLPAEVEDLGVGKFIYDAVIDLYNNSHYHDARIRELLLVEIYKLPDEQFFQLIEDAINGKLTSSEKRWIENTMKEIDNDLKADDSDESIYNQNGRY